MHLGNNIILREPRETVFVFVGIGIMAITNVDNVHINLRCDSASLSLTRKSENSITLQEQFRRPLTNNSIEYYIHHGNALGRHYRLLVPTEISPHSNI